MVFLLRKISVIYSHRFFKEIFSKFIMLSQSEKGLNVIKTFITELKDEFAQSIIIDLIKQDPLGYIEHAYSNYAFQNIIKQWPLVVTQQLFSLIVHHIQRLSLMQSSSNVIEVMLHYSPIEYKSIYISEITASPDISSTHLTRYARQ